MTNDIRVLFVDPLSDAGVSPDRLSDAVTDLTVVSAATMDDALGTLSETRIDCVLSGYSLPDTDGIELINVVRQTRPDLPFILCTESGSEHVASRAISAGVSDYFRTQETDADTLAKRIEQTIRPSSSNEPDRRFDHYQSIVQAMGDGVYTLDTNGRMTAVNDTLVEISGYDREELVGEHISLLLDDVDVERGNRVIRALLADDEDVGQLQAHLHTVEGGTVPCEARIGLLTHNDVFRGTVGVFRSIAEHEHVKRALREEKQRIEELHEVASQMEACQTADELCELTIDAAESILQFDICGIDLVDGEYFAPAAISTGMTDDGYARLRTDQGVAGKTYQNHETYVIDDVRDESDAVPAQSEYRSLLSVPVGDVGIFQAGSRDCSAFDCEDAELAELLVSHTAETLRRIRSQTALRESEEKYRTLVEQSHDAIYIYNDDTFEFLNKRVCELTGYSRDELLDMKIWDLIHPDDRAEVEHIASGRNHEERPPHYEARVVTKDGDVRHIEFSVRVITYEGELANLGSARDVTERKKRKQELKRQNERLEEFASVISHDLRNPLNVAQGNLDLARERGDERHFEKSENALQRMESLIADLLTLARQGQVVSGTESVELTSVVRQAWANVETRDCTLVVNTLETVDADRGRLQELFENLFRNVVEHAGDETTVRVGSLSDGFFVEDDGPGITPEEREAVFEHGHTTAESGSGLGLSIVKGIANAHGWSIRIHEGTDGGACFRIRRA
ncbi:PAS domain S-box protein [Haladaptatus sp. AB643]|uniref:PAS domain S-box protein n=1 Tax=Haladaptatus sp. AB643 TaxID=2934174 RepID=UPI00209C5605|nr:PAS domain S-box protein [Haladaptatus sp. AB643]MCO8245497.1 PAS domain S-box protein [Haladaptatus sp. AB643]